MSEAMEQQGAVSRRRFKPYPAYKDSGVEWLGEIPAGWEVTPVRSLARPGYKTFTDGDWIESPFIRDEGIRLIQTGNIGTGVYKEQGFRYIDDETFRSFRCTELLPGDVLICRLADPVGRACVAPDLGCRMITSVDVCILKTAVDVDPAFVVYTLSGAQYLSWLSGICRGGTRDRVSRSMLGAIRIQKPPYDEQRDIAAFLDRETARIDALVAKKERLIELLQEKRTALITHAVTKGLDPDVPMKDSGVEWLGEIPAHWEAVRVKNTLLDRISGPFGSSLTKDSYGGSTYRVYGQEQVIAGNFGIGDYYIPESKYQAMQRYAVREGDVLLSCVGTFGRAAVVPRDIEPGIINPRLILLRPDRSIIAPSYLECFLRSGLSFAQMDEISRGGTMDIINLSMISALVMPLPPESEQHKILESVRLDASQLDRLVASVREAIDRLKELRTALISAAVTGKIDVREEVA